MTSEKSLLQKVIPPFEVTTTAVAGYGAYRLGRWAFFNPLLAILGAIALWIIHLINGSSSFDELPRSLVTLLTIAGGIATIGFYFTERPVASLLSLIGTGLLDSWTMKKDMRFSAFFGWLIESEHQYRLVVAIGITVSIIYLFTKIATCPEPGSTNTIGRTYGPTISPRGYPEGVVQNLFTVLSETSGVGICFSIKHGLIERFMDGLRNNRARNVQLGIRKGAKTAINDFQPYQAETPERAKGGSRIGSLFIVGVLILAVATFTMKIVSPDAPTVAMPTAHVVPSLGTDALTRCVNATLNPKWCAEHGLK